MVGRTLKKIAAASNDLEIEMVEVTTNPKRTWQDGIRMLPALRCGDKTIAGLTLSAREITSFLESVLDRS